MEAATAVFAAVKAAYPVISAIGTVLGGIGIMSSFKNQKQATNYMVQDRVQSANLFDLSSLQSGVQGLQEKVNIQNDEARRQAAMRAKFAARGIQAEGSPETVMYDSLTVSRRAEQAADFTYDSVATEQALRGRMLKDQARSARSAGLSSAYAGALSDTASLLTSMSRG